MNKINWGSTKIQRRKNRSYKRYLLLWKDLVMEKEPGTYAITAVNMGERPSITIGIAALKKTTERKKIELPEAATTTTI